MTRTQVRIAEADNTAEYWPNLGSQQSTTVIGPVPPVQRSSAGPTTATFVDCLNLLTFSRNLAQYRPYTKPIVTFTMASSSGSRRARVWPMDGTLLGHVSLLPLKTKLRHSIGPLLCQKQVLAARVWARIGLQMHTGVIITAMTRYW